MNKNVHMLKLFLESVMLLTSLKKKRVGWELETGDKSRVFDASREQSACWLCPYLIPGSGFCVFPNRAPRIECTAKCGLQACHPVSTIPPSAYSVCPPLQSLRTLKTFRPSHFANSELVAWRAEGLKEREREGERRATNVNSKRVCQQFHGRHRGRR